MTPATPVPVLVGDLAAEGIAAAKRLDELRNAWLNPPDLVWVEPGLVPGYPDRLLPHDDAAAAVLAVRTLTNLYNARPDWLANARAYLDAAVADDHGLPSDVTKDDALKQLLAFNLERASGRLAEHTKSSN